MAKRNTDQQKIEALKAIKAGDSIEQIASKYEVTPKTVKSWQNKFKIDQFGNYVKIATLKKKTSSKSVHLDSDQIRFLCLNKIISFQKLPSTHKETQTYKVELDEPPISISNQHIIPFSNVKKIHIPKEDIGIFNSHYKIPHLYLANKRKPKSSKSTNQLSLSIPDSESQAVQILPYLLFRRGMLHSLEELFSINAENLVPWYSHWRPIIEAHIFSKPESPLPGNDEAKLLYTLFEKIHSGEKYPEVPLTSKNVSNSRLYRQFGWLGNLLKGYLPTDIDEQSLRKHLEWYKSLNPDNHSPLSILEKGEKEFVPNLFKPVKHLILGYLLALKLHYGRENEHFMYDKDNLFFENNSTLLTYTYFFLGTIQEIYDSYLPLNKNKDLSKFIEKSAILISTKLEQQFSKGSSCNPKIDDKELMRIVKQKKEDRCKVKAQMNGHQVNSKSAIINNDNLKDLGKIHFFPKEYYVLFTKDLSYVENLLNSYLSMFQAKINQVIIVWRTSDIDKLAIDSEFGKMKHYLINKFPEINYIEILLRRSQFLNDRNLVRNLSFLLSGVDPFRIQTFFSEQCVSVMQEEASWVEEASTSSIICNEKDNYLFYN